MISVWRSVLNGTELELKFNFAVKKFVHTFPNFHVAVGCAGTDIIRNVHTAIFKMISEIAGQPAIPRFVISAELDSHKRHFLISQHDPEFLVQDNSELAQTHARNLARNGEMSLVPCCHCFRIGIVCKSRTPLSSSKAENANCCQEKSAETGASWNQAEAIITSQRPHSVGIECVVGLREETGELIHVHASDSEAIVASLKRLGYWTHDFIQNAAEGGSLADRVRAWWLGLRQRRQFRSAAHQQKFDDRARTFFTRMYMGFCNAVDVNDPKERDSISKEMLLLDPAERVSLAKNFGVPLLFGTGIRVSLVGQASNLKWKTDHCLIFPEHDLPWPISKDELEAHISLDGLTERERVRSSILDPRRVHPQWPHRVLRRKPGRRKQVVAPVLRLEDRRCRRVTQDDQKISMEPSAAHPHRGHKTHHALLVGRQVGGSMSRTHGDDAAHGVGLL